MSTSFEPTAKTRVRRKPDRGFYDDATIFHVLDAGVICHVGYVIDGEPYVTPTASWREGRHLYWHGSSASRMLRHQAQGVPVCVTVSHLDGFVLARSGFHHSLRYRSVMAFGRASPVTEIEQKRRALDAFIDRLFPGRSREIRPAHGQELKGTSVMTMVIDAAAAKIREGGVVDEEEDYALPCWAGVIPVRTVVGEIIDDARLLAGVARPANLAAYAEGVPLGEVLAGAAESEVAIARTG
jgi:hypothetical protein